jgi:hypothetical protein
MTVKANRRVELRKINPSLSRVLGYPVTQENRDDAIKDLDQQVRKAERKNAKLKLSDAAMAWVKLASVFTAMASLDTAIQDFTHRHEFSPLVEDGAVGDLIHELQDYLREQSGLIAGAAAKVVAG